MTAAEFTLELFSRVDDALSDVLKHPLAHFHLSEVVTIDILQALRGDGGRAFYRWLKFNLCTAWNGEVKLSLVDFAL